MESVHLTVPSKMTLSWYTIHRIFQIIEIFDAKDDEMEEEQIIKYFKSLKNKGVDIPKLLDIKNYQVYDPKYKPS